MENTPTIKELIQSTSMTQTAFSKRFGIPLRTVQDWYGERRKCPDYIRSMIVEILRLEAENGKSKSDLQV